VQPEQPDIGARLNVSPSDIPSRFRFRAAATADARYPIQVPLSEADVVLQCGKKVPPQINMM
jgi:hypothetical protein